MCEIKLKEMTDGSEIREGGEAEGAARKAAAVDLQHQRRVLLRNKQNFTWAEKWCWQRESLVVATTSGSNMRWDFNCPLATL